MQEELEDDLPVTPEAKTDTESVLPEDNGKKPVKPKKKKPNPDDPDDETDGSEEETDDDSEESEDSEDSEDDDDDDDDDDTETSGSDTGTEDENELKQEEKKQQTTFKNPFEFFVKPENQALKQKNNAPDKPQRSPLQKFFDVLLYGVEGAKIRNGELPKTAIADELLLGLGFKAYLKDVLLNKQIAKFWKQKVAGKENASLLKTGIKALKKQGIKDSLLKAFVSKKTQVDKKTLQLKTIDKPAKSVEKTLKSPVLPIKEGDKKEAVSLTKKEEKKDILNLLKMPIRPAKVGEKETPRKKLVITKENAREILKAVEQEEKKIKETNQKEQKEKEKTDLAQQKSQDLQQKEAQKAVAALAASFAHTEKAQAQSQTQAQKENLAQQLGNAVQADKMQMMALAQSQEKNHNLNAQMAEKNQLLANQKNTLNAEEQGKKAPVLDMGAVIAPMMGRVMKKAAMSPEIQKVIDRLEDKLPKVPRPRLPHPKENSGATARFVEHIAQDREERAHNQSALGAAAQKVQNTDEQASLNVQNGRGGQG